MGLACRFATLLAIIAVAAVGAAPPATAALAEGPALEPGALVLTIETSDFDTDGDDDLALSAQDELLLFDGQGDGTFETWESVKIGADLTDIESLYVNRDADPDLALIDESRERLYVLLGRGDGTFKHRASFRTTFRSLRIASGDLDGDGRDDLVITSPDKTRAVVFITGGEGVFQRSRVHVGEAAGEPDLADYTGDGARDLALGASDRLVFLEGNADGSFGTPEAIELVPGIDQVSSADLNNDNAIDLAISARNGGAANGVYVMLAESEGPFGEASQFGFYGDPSDVELVDLDGDGFEDQIVSRSRFLSDPDDSSELVVVYGLGGASFGDSAGYDLDGLVGRLAVGSFDEDPLLDVAVIVRDPESRVRVFLGTSP